MYGQHMLYGAAVLSKGLTHVVLVKPSGCPLWCFPVGTVEAGPGAEAAAKVVLRQTGVDISKYISENEYIDAIFPVDKKSQTRMYIVHSLPKGNLTPDIDSSIDSAEWRQIGEVINVSIDTPIDEQPSMPLILPLRDWIAKRHDLRFFGDVMMGSYTIYSSLRWSGPKPLEILQSNLKNLLLPKATIMEFIYEENCNNEENKKTKEYCATCTIPHLGIQITPEVTYTQIDDAKENAALSGILYLNDCIDDDSKGFTINVIGDTLKMDIPFKEQVVNIHQLEAIQNQRKHYQKTQKSHERKLMPWIRPKLPLELRKKIGYDKPEKNAISLLKEFSDKMRCSQPEYVADVLNDGNLTKFCFTVYMRSIMVGGVTGDVYPDDKEAKRSAANRFLDILITRRMIVIVDEI